MKRIFFSAGEVSGDFNTSCIAKSISSSNQTIEMVGIGGDRMRGCGVKILFDFIPLSSIGIIESIIPGLKLALKLISIRSYLKKHVVDLIVLVDNQGINIPLAKLAKRLKIPTIYYFPPQVSVWGEWNVKKISRLVDLILSPFYEDYRLYKNAGGKVLYVGHPMLELIKSESKESDISSSTCKTRDYVIGLFPGSRKQEIKKLLPILLKFAELISKKYSLIFLIPVSSNHFVPYIKDLLLEYAEINITLINQGNYKSYKQCDIAVLASGTVSLELALLKIPMVVVYKVNYLTYLFAKLLVKSKYISLPNILLNENIVPELIQYKVNPENIFNKVNKFITDPKCCFEYKEKLQKLEKVLGDGNTINYVSELIISQLNKTYNIN